MPKHTVVLTGTFPGKTKNEVVSLLGGYDTYVASEVSQKTDFVIQGEMKKRSSTLQMAGRRKIPVIGLEEYLDLLDPSRSEGFFPEGLRGDEPSDVLGPILRGLPWKDFRPDKHGAFLRTLLQKHEAAFAVCALHKEVSELVREHLILLHPFGHDDEITSHDISPDGKWLATGSWMSEDYERGGVLQIWEIETGRIVNRLRIHGGVGWPDYKGMQWSPDSQEIALAYDTNAIGVWEPFGESGEPRAYAYVTNGSNRPPWFGWSPDGTKIFIQSNIDHDWEKNGSEGYDEDRGCWIEVFRREGSLERAAVPGYFADLQAKTPETPEAPAISETPETPAISETPETPAISETPETPTKTKAKTKKSRNPKTKAQAPLDKAQNLLAKIAVPLVRQDAVIFPHLQDGQGAGEFFDRPPGEKHPMYADGHDWSRSFAIRPTFPLQHQGREMWGVAFESGALVVPKDFPAERLLNFSLGRRWAWPLSWVEHLRAETMGLMAAKKGTPIPTGFRAFYKAQDKQKTSTTWPPLLGKTHDDLVKMTLETLYGLSTGWSSHIDEYLLEVALTEVLRGKLDSAWEILQSISPKMQSFSSAEIAFHCIKRKLPYERFFERATSTFPGLGEWMLCQTHAFLAILAYQRNDLASLATHTALAEEHRLPETNSGQKSWPMLRMYLMTGRTEQACKNLKAWNVPDSSSYMASVWQDLVWYGTLEEMVAFQKACLEAGAVREYDLYNYLAQKIRHDRAYDKVQDLAPLFGSYSSHLLASVAALAEDDPDAPLPLLLSFFDDKPSREWLEVLELTSRKDPATALSALSKRTWKLPDAASWGFYLDGKYDAFFHTGRVVGRLGLWPSFETEASGLTEDFRIAFLAGVACHSSPDAGTALLEDADKLLRPRPSGLYVTNLWGMIAVGALLCKSPRSEAWVKEATLRAIQYDKDLDLERLSSQFARAGEASAAYQAWMKIPLGSRRYRMHNLFTLLCKKADCDGLFDLLRSLGTSDLNDRGSHATTVLKSLTKSRDARYNRF